MQIKALCKVIPRQIKAEKAVTLIQRTVEELIAKCKEIVESEGERINEEEYVNDTDPSILRFLLASREEVCAFFLLLCITMTCSAYNIYILVLKLHWFNMDKICSNNLLDSHTETAYISVLFY